MNQNLSAEVVVQRQLDAYNARDLDLLLKIYADDVELYEHPDKLQVRGTAQARERMALRFKEPHLHAKLIERMVMGNIVIDHELVTRTFPEGPGTLELIATYQVVNGRIAKGWFMYGEKILFGTV